MKIGIAMEQIQFGLGIVVPDSGRERPQPVTMATCLHQALLPPHACENRRSCGSTRDGKSFQHFRRLHPSPHAQYPRYLHPAAMIPEK